MAALRVLAGTPEEPQRVELRARWIGGEFRADLSVRGRAPLAEDLTGAPAGSLDVSIDAAARLGTARWRFGGVAGGEMRRTPVPVPAAPTDLIRVRLDGSARVLGDTEDGAAPSVAIASPTGPTVPAGAVEVTGALRDDRTLARLTWALGDGPETDVPFAADPSTGFLGEISGEFSFSIPVSAGLAHLTLRAYDAAGNSGAATADFLVSTPRTVVLGAGEYAASATSSTGALLSWGGRSSGSYTFGDFKAVPVPTAVEGVTDVTAVAEGSIFTLALRSDGTILAWGRNHRGQLGDGTFVNRGTPAPVQGLDQVVAIAAGTEHAMALRADGSVWAWGGGGSGQLGNRVSGHPSDRPLPAPVEGIPPMTAIAASTYASYSLDEDGTVWEWAGMGHVLFETHPGTLPHALPGLPKTVSIAAGWGHVAEIAEDGTVWAVGVDGYKYGSLGGASPGTGWTVPGITGATSLACGAYHTLVVLEDGTVVGFGNNLAGQLGDGTTTNRPAAIPVPGLTGVVSVAAGASTSYAVLEDGSLRAFGWNHFGAVGDGTTVDRHEPVVVSVE